MAIRPPSLLLLHGNPRVLAARKPPTHATWHLVAHAVAQHCSVMCPALCGCASR